MGNKEKVNGGYARFFVAERLGTNALTEGRFLRICNTNLTEILILWTT